MTTKTAYDKSQFWNIFPVWYDDLVKRAYASYDDMGYIKDKTTEEKRKLYSLSFEEGRRYVKLIHRGSQNSVFGFVDKETGAVLKAASWKAPATNFSRGHITKPLDQVRWTGIN